MQTIPTCASTFVDDSQTVCTKPVLELLIHLMHYATHLWEFQQQCWDELSKQCFISILERTSQLCLEAD